VKRMIGQSTLSTGIRTTVNPAPALQLLHADRFNRPQLARLTSSPRAEGHPRQVRTGANLLAGQNWYSGSYAPTALPVNKFWT
jgi:hypothetical protein